MINNTISVFGGKGFILGKFVELYPEISYIEPRENNVPKYDNIIFGISTVHNYNLYSNVQIDVDTNIKKLLSVLDNCKNRENLCFNFLSSWFVYGSQDKLPVKEDANCNAKGFYSITKRTAEELLISFCQVFNIKYRIFRISNVIGRGDKFNKQKNALQFLIGEIKQNKNIDLYYDGKFIRDYLPVEEVCRAIKYLIDYSSVNQIYNIGSGQPYVFRDLIDYCVKKANSTTKINSIDAPEFHKLVQVRDFFLDIKKLTNLGFRSKINIYDYLDSLL